MNYERRGGDRTEISIDIPLLEPRVYSSIKHTDPVEIHSKYASDTDQVLIPLSVFHSKFSTLQLVVKYLHDAQKLTFNEIADLLNRSYKSIWTTYRSVPEHVKLEIMPSRINVPTSIFSSRDLSPLEAVVNFLKGFDLRYSEIALLLRKDQRTVWTVNNRASKKLQKSKDKTQDNG